MHPISINTEQVEQLKKSYTHLYHLKHFLDQKVGTIGRRLEKWEQAKSRFYFFKMKLKFIIVFFKQYTGFISFF